MPSGVYKHKSNQGFQKDHPFYKGSEKGWLKKGHKKRVGQKTSEETKEKQRHAKLKNPVKYWLGKKRKNLKWKNYTIEYGGLHERIKKQITKPTLCAQCNQEKKLCLSNISGQYKEDLKDWEYVCYKCHYIIDRSRKSIVEKINGHLVFTDFLKKQNEKEKMVSSEKVEKRKKS